MQLVGSSVYNMQKCECNSKRVSNVNDMTQSIGVVAVTPEGIIAKN